MSEVLHPLVSGIQWTENEWLIVSELFAQKKRQSYENVLILFLNFFRVKRVLRRKKDNVQQFSLGSQLHIDVTWHELALKIPT